MASGAQAVPCGDRDPARTGKDDDAALLRLSAAFIARAQARSVEGARLDSMEWSSAVDCGYGELNRGLPAHQNMLAEILAAEPATVLGLLAKAHAVRVHQRDPESEPVTYAQLADDIIRLFGQGPAGRPPLSRAEAGRPHLVPPSRPTRNET